MALLQLLVFLGSFVMVWYGAGRIISAADRFSRKLKVSSFAFSFVVLGLLTSTPEFAVGLTAVSEKNPEIYVGNLIGGVPVLFLFAIPILAIFGRGLKLKKTVRPRNLLFSFIVMLLPIVSLFDRQVTIFESIFFIVAYFVLLFFIQKEKGLLDDENDSLFTMKSYSAKDLLSVLFGIGLVFVASHYIVDGTRFFASFFNISTFFISIVLLSIGTNIPELSLALRAILAGKKDVAFGDYVGSGAANTFLFGFFGLINGATVTVANHFLTVFGILAIGLLLFFFFARSKAEISRNEGLVLVCLYILFIVVEFL